MLRSSFLGLALTQRIIRRPFASQRHVGFDDSEVLRAREFLKNFQPGSIPETICDISFSRSSGPGGQNVNKVNSKATLKVSLEQLFKIVPPLLHSAIRASPYCTSKSEAVVIQSDDSRKQSANRQSCFVKLHHMITQAGANIVPGETSDAQKKHVNDLAAAETHRRLQSKKIQSAKKSSRKGGKASDY